MKKIPVKVSLYSGYMLEEKPLSFYLNEREYRITEIIEQWLENAPTAGQPIFACFRVKTTDGQIFLLELNKREHCWTVRVD